MSSAKRTTCDLCGIHKPDDYNKSKGWVFVMIDGEAGKNLDFCPPCWSPVNRIMLRSFVDGLMMEAQGFEEIDE